MREDVKRALAALVGEDVANQFAAQVDDANKEIRERGMIVRSAQGPKVERRIIRVVYRGSNAKENSVPSVTTLPDRKPLHIPVWRQSAKNAKEPGSLVEAASSTLATLPAFGMRRATR